MPIFTGWVSEVYELAQKKGLPLKGTVEVDSTKVFNEIFMSYFLSLLHKLQCGSASNAQWVKIKGYRLITEGNFEEMQNMVDQQPIVAGAHFFPDIMV